MRNLIPESLNVYFFAGGFLALQILSRNSTKFFIPFDLISEACLIKSHRVRDLYVSLLFIVQPVSAAWCFRISLNILLLGFYNDSLAFSSIFSTFLLDILDFCMSFGWSWLSSASVSSCCHCKQSACHGLTSHQNCWKPQLLHI